MYCTPQRIKTQHLIRDWLSQMHIQWYFVFFIYAFSLAGVGIRWCNVAAWITALGLGSLTRWDPDRLGLKSQSSPLGIKFRNGHGRCRTSLVEFTSKMTPIMINNLQGENFQVNFNFMAKMLNLSYKNIKSQMIALTKNGYM